MLRGFVTAMRTLTSLPVPGRDADDHARSLPWFPIVGLLLGLATFGIGLLTGLRGGTWPEGTAMLLVLAGVLLTRGLHLDGLADFADAFWGAGSRDKTLAIMKDSRIGVFGGVALVTMLLARWVCLVRLIDIGHAAWIIPGFVVSRHAQVVLAVLNPYAREDGGMGERFVGNARARHLVVATITAAIVLLVVGGFNPRWLAALIAGWILPLLLGAWFRARIGGVTGDLLGACSEIVEVTVLAMGCVI